MPELPEVERVAQTLTPVVVGRAVAAVDLYRPDVVRGTTDAAALLEGATIGRIERRGKQLAMIGGRGDGEMPIGVGSASERSPCVCIHLGMSGSLRYFPPSVANPPTDRHCHLFWRFEGGGCMVFRDPRRFGGIWTFANMQQLHEQRWRHLGPDALVIKPAELFERLTGTSRCTKTALLDQHLVAGLGNIYVDELLFACGVHPQMPARRTTRDDAAAMVRRLRRLLNQAIEKGGSTLRDYIDGNGYAGGFQDLHKVYGRGGAPCQRCGRALQLIRLAQRATVFCPRCQPLRRKSKRTANVA